MEDFCNNSCYTSGWRPLKREDNFNIDIVKKNNIKALPRAVEFELNEEINKNICEINKNICEINKNIEGLIERMNIEFCEINDMINLIQSRINNFSQKKKKFKIF